MSIYEMSREDYITALENKIEWISESRKPLRYHSFWFYTRPLGFSGSRKEMTCRQSDSITDTVAYGDYGLNFSRNTDQILSALALKLSSVKVCDFECVKLSREEFDEISSRRTIAYDCAFYDEYDYEWILFSFEAEGRRELEAPVEKPEVPKNEIIHHTSIIDKIFNLFNLTKRRG